MRVVRGGAAAGVDTAADAGVDAGADAGIDAGAGADAAAGAGADGGAGGGGRRGEGLGLVRGLGEEFLLRRRRPAPVQLRAVALHALRPNHGDRGAAEQDARGHCRAPPLWRPAASDGHGRAERDRHRGQGEDIRQHAHRAVVDRRMDDPQHRDHRHRHRRDQGKAFQPGRAAEEQPPEHDAQPADHADEHDERAGFVRHQGRPNPGSAHSATNITAGHSRSGRGAEVRRREEETGPDASGRAVYWTWL